ncbi:hypothetical protein H0H87_000437 [Tephrocybe sp. NHM501043]|nr:hypothetical protein H0H87_000437 [Tephrocybe sp. NHM501043]
MAEINGGDFHIEHTLSLDVNNLTIAHFVNLFTRFTTHQQASKTVVEPIPQQIQSEIVDLLDLTTLIVLTQSQRDAQVLKYDSKYRAHVLYPYESLEKINALTAHVSQGTFLALEAGHQFMEPIEINHNAVSLDLHMDWGKNKMLQMIIGLIEEAMACQTPV